MTDPQPVSNQSAQSKLPILSPGVVGDLDNVRGICREYGLNYLVAIQILFCASVIVTNVVGAKVATFQDFDFTAGIVTYAAVFLCTDIVGEVWGKRSAYFMVFMGFVANIFALLYIKFAIFLEPAAYWAGNQVHFEATLGGVPIIVLASMAAYMVSQVHDVWAYDFIKIKTKGRYLYLRNNVSTFASQFIDTIIFISIAFGPWGFEYSLDQVFVLIVGQITVKFFLALLDTPLIYGLKILLVKKIPRGEEMVAYHD